MKKNQFFIAALLVLMNISAISAAETNESNFQFGNFVSYNQGAGYILNYEAGNIAFGSEFYYRFPFFENFDFGLSGSVDFGFAAGKKDFIECWNVMDIFSGVWCEFDIGHDFAIRPELEYGFALNFVRAESRDVSGTYADQLLRTGAILLWEPEYIKGFSLYGGFNYQLMPEQMHAANFISFKTGVMYRP